MCIFDYGGERAARDHALLRCSWKFGRRVSGATVGSSLRLNAWCGAWPMMRNSEGSLRKTFAVPELDQLFAETLEGRLGDFSHILPWMSDGLYPPHATLGECGSPQPHCPRCTLHSHPTSSACFFNVSLVANGRGPNSRPFSFLFFPSLSLLLQVVVPAGSLRSRAQPWLRRTCFYRVHTYFCCCIKLVLNPLLSWTRLRLGARSVRGG